MRHAGLDEAIKAAGGVAALARAIGIAQPSVSAWSRIPAERVIAVEAATRVPRFILRPDLYPAGQRVRETPMRVIGFAGWSGAGKTTLLKRVIPLLTAQGLRVSTIKHAHHDFDVDKPGKDSHVHREAGATEVLVSSAQRWALMHELRGDAEPSLAELLSHMSPVDLVMVEGFKADRHPKIEVHRKAHDRDFLHPHDPAIVGIATDALPRTALPIVHIDDTEAVAALICKHAARIDDVFAPATVQVA